jgi:hypothetical protein
MRITAVIAPEANHALEMLRRGCAAREQDKASLEQTIT